MITTADLTDTQIRTLKQILASRSGRELQGPEPFTVAFGEAAVGVGALHLGDKIPAPKVALRRLHELHDLGLLAPVTVKTYRDLYRVTEAGLEMMFAVAWN